MATKTELTLKNINQQLRQTLGLANEVARSPKCLHELPLGSIWLESVGGVNDGIIVLSVLAGIGENGQEEPSYFFGSEGWGFKSLRRANRFGCSSAKLIFFRVLPQSHRGFV
jgi:hypothetical protein